MKVFRICSNLVGWHLLVEEHHTKNSSAFVLNRIGSRSRALKVSGLNFLRDLRVPKDSYMGVSKAVAAFFWNSDPSTRYRSVGILWTGFRQWGWCRWKVHVVASTCQRTHSRHLYVFWSQHWRCRSHCSRCISITCTDEYRGQTRIGCHGSLHCSPYWVLGYFSVLNRVNIFFSIPQNPICSPIYSLWRRIR